MVQLKEYIDYKKFTELLQYGNRKKDYIDNSIKNINEFEIEIGLPISSISITVNNEKISYDNENQIINIFENSKETGSDCVTFLSNNLKVGLENNKILETVANQLYMDQLSMKLQKLILYQHQLQQQPQQQPNNNEKPIEFIGYLSIILNCSEKEKFKLSFTKRENKQPQDQQQAESEINNFKFKLVYKLYKENHHIKEIKNELNKILSNQVLKLVYVLDNQQQQQDISNGGIQSFKELKGKDKIVYEKLKQIGNGNGSNEYHMYMAELKIKEKVNGYMIDSSGDEDEYDEDEDSSSSSSSDDDIEFEEEVYFNSDDSTDSENNTNGESSANESSSSKSYNIIRHKHKNKYINNNNNNQLNEEDEEFKVYKKRKIEKRIENKLKKINKQLWSNNNTNTPNSASTSPMIRKHFQQNKIEYQQQYLINFIDIVDDKSIDNDDSSLILNVDQDYQEILPFKSLNKIGEYKITQEQTSNGQICQTRYYKANTFVIFKSKDISNILFEYCPNEESIKKGFYHFINKLINHLHTHEDTEEYSNLLSIIKDLLELYPFEIELPKELNQLIMDKVPGILKKVVSLNIKRFLQQPYIFFDKFESILEHFNSDEINQVTLLYRKEISLVMNIKHQSSSNIKLFNQKLVDLYTKKLLPCHYTHPTIVDKRILRSFINQNESLFLPLELQNQDEPNYNNEISKTLSITLHYISDPIGYISKLIPQLKKLYKSIDKPNSNHYNQILNFYRALKLTVQKKEFQTYYSTIVLDKHIEKQTNVPIGELVSTWMSLISLDDIEQSFTEQCKFSEFVIQHYDFRLTFELIKQFQQQLLEQICGNFNIDAFIIIWKSTSSHLIRYINSNQYIDQQHQLPPQPSSIDHSLQPTPLTNVECIDMNSFLMDKNLTFYKFSCSQTILRNQVLKYLGSRSDLSIVKTGKTPIYIEITKKSSLNGHLQNNNNNNNNNHNNQQQQKVNDQLEPYYQMIEYLLNFAKNFSSHINFNTSPLTLILKNKK